MAVSPTTQFKINQVKNKPLRRVLKVILNTLDTMHDANKAAYVAFTTAVTVGPTSVTDHCGLAIHGSNKENALTARGFTYDIAGTAYYLAAQTEIDLSACAATATDTALGTQTSRAYLLHVDSTGTVDFTPGDDLAGTAAASAVVPDWPANKVGFGVIKRSNESTANDFTLGTTSMLTSGTTTFTSLTGIEAGALADTFTSSL